jgi:hypothetical protein
LDREEEPPLDRPELLDFDDLLFDLAELRPPLLRAGTLAPFFRASESPIAIACLRLVTFFPLLPLLSVPFLRLRIADLTVS